MIAETPPDSLPTHTRHDELACVVDQLDKLSAVQDYEALGRACSALVCVLDRLRELQSQVYAAPPSTRPCGRWPMSNKGLTDTALRDATILTAIALGDAGRARNYAAGVCRARHAAQIARIYLDHLALTVDPECLDIHGYTVRSADRAIRSRRVAEEMEQLNRQVAPRRWWEIWRRNV